MPDPINLNTIPAAAVYVTKRQAADMLGLSTSWVNKQMAEGKLRSFKISARRVLFLKDDVLNLVAVTEQAG